MGVLVSTYCPEHQEYHAYWPCKPAAPTLQPHGPDSRLSDERGIWEREPLSDERLGDIETDHGFACLPTPSRACYDEASRSCAVLLLVAEIRRLRRGEM